MLRIFAAFAVLFAMAMPAEAQSRREQKMMKAVETMNKGIQALQGGDAATAVTLLTEAIDMNVLKEENLRIAHFVRGASYANLDQCPQGIPDFTMAIDIGLEIKNDDPQVYAQRGACFTKTGKPAEAVADLKKAVALEPANKEYAEFLCATAFNAKLHAEAGAACEHAVVTFAPDNQELVQAAAQAYEQAGNKAKANEMWKKLLALDPASEAAKQGIARTK